MEKDNHFSGTDPKRTAKFGGRLIRFWHGAKDLERSVLLGNTERRLSTSELMARFWNRQFDEMKEKVRTSDDGNDEVLLIDGDNHHLELTRQLGQPNTLKLSRVKDIDNLGNVLIAANETYAQQPGTGLVLFSSQVDRFPVMKSDPTATLTEVDIAAALNSAFNAFGHNRASRIISSGQLNPEFMARIDFKNSSHEPMCEDVHMHEHELEDLYASTKRTIDLAMPRG